MARKKILFSIGKVLIIHTHYGQDRFHSGGEASNSFKLNQIT